MTPLIPLNIHYLAKEGQETILLPHTITFRNIAMNKIKYVALSAIVLAVSPLTKAADFSYNYVEFNIGQYSPSTGSSGSGYNFAGSYGIGESFYLLANYDSVTISGNEIFDFTAGVGYHMPVGESVNLTADISRRVVSVGTSSWFGVSAMVGIRYMATPKLELRTAFSRANLTGFSNVTGTAYNFGAIYSVSDKMGVIVDYKSDGSFPWSFYKAGVRINL